MAAEKKGQTIVIKKIYVSAGGHGGAWKVALADFMTAMMAFFLVMWLVAQSEETKKAVSDHFSTPSIVEYNFQNFGVEITLEKLFLDLINEPLKAFQSFLEPVDKTPNLLDMGSQKVVAAFMADQLGDLAKNFNVSPDGIEFDIVDMEMFIPGSAKPNSGFIAVTNKLKEVTTGLQDANIDVVSQIFNQSVMNSNPEMANAVARERLDLIKNKIAASLEHNTVDLSGQIDIKDKKDFVEGQGNRPPGLIKIRIKQKALKADGTKPRKLERIFDSTDKEENVYENFVKQAVKQKTKSDQ